VLLWWKCLGRFGNQTDSTWWVASHYVTVFKGKGSRSDCKNYWGVPLLLFLAKVMHVIPARIKPTLLAKNRVGSPLFTEPWTEFWLCAIWPSIDANLGERHTLLMWTSKLHLISSDGQLCGFYCPDVRLESWSRDVLRPVFKSWSRSWSWISESWSWSWNPRVSVSVLVLGP